MLQGFKDFQRSGPQEPPFLCHSAALPPDLLSLMAKHTEQGARLLLIVTADDLGMVPERDEGIFQVLEHHLALSIPSAGAKRASTAFVRRHTSARPHLAGPAGKSGGGRHERVSARHRVDGSRGCPAGRRGRALAWAAPEPHRGSPDLLSGGRALAALFAEVLVAASGRATGGWGGGGDARENGSPGGACAWGGSSSASLELTVRLFPS